MSSMSQQSCSQRSTSISPANWTRCEWPSWPGLINVNVSVVSSAPSRAGRANRFIECRLDIAHQLHCNEWAHHHWRVYSLNCHLGQTILCPTVMCGIRGPSRGLDVRVFVPDFQERLPRWFCYRKCPRVAQSLRGGGGCLRCPGDFRERSTGAKQG